MSASRYVLLAALAGANVLVGCVSFHRPAFATPEATRDWSTSLATARAIAGTGRYVTADSILAAFASSHPGTPEALETAYWRALFMMDPMNPKSSLISGLASLDGYLADTRPREHVLEATSIRRVAGELDGVNRTVASAMEQARAANTSAAHATARVANVDARAADTARPDPTPSLDGEVKRLRDELAKANAELERIRKRLSQPGTKPPRV